MRNFHVVSQEEQPQEAKAKNSILLYVWTLFFKLRHTLDFDFDVKDSFILLLILCAYIPLKSHKGFCGRL